jgi:hypothetical protein
LLTPGADVKLTRCAVYSMAAGEPYTGRPARGVSLEAANWRLAMDHCDVVTSGTAILAQSNTFTARQLSLSNSNIISLHGNGVAMTPATGDSLDLFYNNVYAPEGTAYMGPTPGPGDVTPALDPDYRNPEGFDFRYGEEFLMTADSEGGPIGANRDFNALEISSAASWWMYYR